jgi:hypothetical protein
VVRVPAPATTVVAPEPRTGNIGDFFGDGNFNVRINTPDFNIEYWDLWLVQQPRCLLFILDGNFMY